MEQSHTSHKILLKVVWLSISLYIFLLSIELLGISMKMMGEGFVQKLLTITAHPLIGLFIGVLTTSIIQSSSATTSITVGMVAAGTLTLRNAVPIVMGANIGTTVTNILVSLGCITRPQEFRRAFAAATVHDFFNLLSVIIFLPLEASIHFLETGAKFLTNIFANVGGLTLISPLKFIVAPVSHLVADMITSLCGNGLLGAIMSGILSLIILFVALTKIVNLVKSVVLGKVEILLHKYIFTTPLRGFIFGLLLTGIIQSSSVVTSLIVPLAAAGILSLEQIFPYTLGANIGTTVTALMASMVTGRPEAISTALVHTLFNMCGTIVWFPLRKVPMTLAKILAEIAYKRRWLAITYVIITFFAIPIILIVITGGF